jgi:hypothetical protein
LIESFPLGRRTDPDHIVISAIHLTALVRGKIRVLGEATSSFPLLKASQRQFDEVNEAARGLTAVKVCPWQVVSPLVLPQLCERDSLLGEAGVASSLSSVMDRTKGAKAAVWMDRVYLESLRFNPTYFCGFPLYFIQRFARIKSTRRRQETRQRLRFQLGDTTEESNVRRQTPAQRQQANGVFGEQSMLRERSRSLRQVQITKHFLESRLAESFCLKEGPRSDQHCACCWVSLDPLSIRFIASDKAADRFREGWQTRRKHVHP